MTMDFARSAERTGGTEKPKELPRLCFVGPLAGRRTAVVVTQGVRLSAHFDAAGYSVIAVSGSSNRYVRLIDIAATIIRKRKEIDILVIHVYGGASFVVANVASFFWRRVAHPVAMIPPSGAPPPFIASHPRPAHPAL